MAEHLSCPSCDKPLPANAPSGMCPGCLMQAAVIPHHEPTVTPAASHGFVPPEVSTLAGRFAQLEVLQLIGCGGMGAVYKARQTKLDRTVALKILRPETSHDASFAERFNREARTLARLSHSNIVGVHDFGELTVPDEDGIPRVLYYFVMEFVDGADLRQLMNAEVSPQEALSIVSQVCAALQYAHEEGIVHRDIKPENILLDTQGKVKIADFGLAKLATTSEHERTLTGTHQVMGTPRYMAPEQMEGSRTVDHRADLYSLGVVLYEMLTGEVPMGQFEPPSKKTPTVNADLDSVVLRAMAREPERRFQSANDMLSGLADAAAHAPGLAHGPLPGASTILDMAVHRAMAGIKRGVAGKTGIGSALPSILELVFSTGALATLVWLLASKAAAAAGDYDMFDNEPGIFAAVINLFILVLVLLSFGLNRKPSLWRSLYVLYVAIAVAPLTILYTLMEVDWKSDAYTRNLCITAFTFSIGLLLTAIWDLRLCVAEKRRRRKPGKARKPRKSMPESAHVGFVVPSSQSPVPYIAPHFQMLGYQLVDQSASEWVFERGSKSGHMGVDPRKCFTVLTVRIGPRPDGGTWVSCGWAIQAFVTGGEVAKLEREGQSFATALGVDSINLTAAETKQVLRRENLVSVLGGSSKTGHWTPSQNLNAVCLLGGSTLDFREAELKPGVTNVHVVGILSIVEINVPADVAVEVSGSGILGTFGYEGGDSRSPSSPDSPVLRFHGISLLSDVTIATKTD